MKRLLSLFCAGALVCALGASCHDDNGQEPDWDEKDWVDVSFTEYSMEEGTSGEEISIDWTNLNDVEAGKSRLLLINSDKELEQYVEGDYYAIDFSKKTLVLAYGYGSGVGTFHDGHKFQQVSDYNYVMTVNLIMSALTAFFHWHVAIVVDKLPSKCNIELKTVSLN